MKAGFELSITIQPRQFNSVRVSVSREEDVKPGEDYHDALSRIRHDVYFEVEESLRAAVNKFYGEEKK